MGNGPFNGWYHVTCWMFGQWVRGDLRGWRARHHREHCEGDYKHRPDPKEHEAKRRFSYDAMKRDPVRLARHLRGVVVDAVCTYLVEHAIDVLCAEIDAVHLHVLARFPKRNVRDQIGWAKYRATKDLKAHCSAVGFDLGLKRGEGIWGKRCGVKPIRNRHHQLEVVAYILDHAHAGGVTWITPGWRDRADAVTAWVQERRGS